MVDQSTRVVPITHYMERLPDDNPATEVHRLRTEIEDARDGLGMYVTELDRRRHSAFDVKHQLKTHKALGIGVGVATVAAAAGSVAMVVRSLVLGKVLLRAIPKGLKAARGVAERAVANRRPRLATRLV